MSKPTALDVAAAIIEWESAHPHPDAPLTHEKLQFLLFYCQAWHLAWYDEPLFDDPIYWVPDEETA